VYEETLDTQPALRLPSLGAPIDRTPSGAAAFSSEAGVDASFDWGGLLGSVAQTALPILASAL
jgi:hypothetical protein